LVEAVYRLAAPPWSQPAIKLSVAFRHLAAVGLISTIVHPTRVLIRLQAPVAIGSSRAPFRLYISKMFAAEVKPARYALCLHCTMAARGCCSFALQSRGRYVAVFPMPGDGGRSSVSALDCFSPISINAPRVGLAAIETCSISGAYLCALRCC
jgi:hypothetical protein